MRKLAVFFPGIGYTAGMPLLHYCRRMAAGLDYEIRLLTYNGFPRQVRGDRAKMALCLRLALEQSRDMLSDLELTAYDEILFVGKSIGTVAAAAIAAESPAGDRIRFVMYTPLEETFSFPFRNAIVFTGSRDPWVGGEASRIPMLCRERGLPCFVIPEGNHSLESDRVETDIQNLQTIMQETDRFLRGTSPI